MFYSLVTFTIFSVVVLPVKLTLQVTSVQFCSAEGLKAEVELCVCVTAVTFSVMFPVM